MKTLICTGVCPVLGQDGIVHLLKNEKMIVDEILETFLLFYRQNNNFEKYIPAIGFTDVLTGNVYSIEKGDFKRHITLRDPLVSIAEEWNSMYFESIK